jgi:hypothetical protein
VYPVDRNTDVHYAALMNDPLSTVEEVCEHIDVGLDADSRRRAAEWTDSHPRTQHGVHRYSAADFGLDTGRLRDRFAFYTNRFSVAAEPAPR